MKWDQEYQDVSNRANLDLSEVVWYRLAGSFMANEEGNSPNQASHQPEKSPSESPVFVEADRICQGKAEVATLEQPPESKPLHVSLVPQEGNDIREGFWKSEVRSIKRSVAKLKRSQKILNALCVALLFLFVIGLALIGKNNWG